MVRIKQRYLLLNVLYPEQDRIKTSPSTPSYLDFHGPAPSHINSQTFLSTLKTEVIQLFGDHGIGLSLSSLKIVYYSQATSTAILRVPRAYFQLIWAALTLLQELPAKTQNHKATRCAVRVVRVSGTIKKAQQELLRRSRRTIARAKIVGGETDSDVLGKLLGDYNSGQPLPAPQHDDEEIVVSEGDESEND